MASRPKGYGLTAEVRGKIDGKYDEGLAQEAKDWIEAVTGERLEPSGVSAQEFHEALKDGTVLCKLMNSLVPQSIKKINTNKMAFKQMENIGFFLEVATNYGVAKPDLFQTVDLYEAQNMPQVVNTIHALGRKAHGRFDGPVLGPKEADRNTREFTEEQLKEGQNVIGLQMGSNKGASQAGQNFGKQRMIID